MHLILANKLYSSWSLRPWLLMRAANIPFEEETIPLGQPDSKARMLARGPTGKVPVLIDDDVAVWESLAIIEYVAEKFPDKHIWPSDPAARAHARSASSEMHAGFQPLRAACPMNLSKRFAARDFGADVAASVNRIETLWREARSRFAAGASEPFLYGTFSAADAMYAPIVTRLDTYQLAVAPDTRAYMDAILQYPAFRQWRTNAIGEPREWDLPHYEVGHTAVEDYRA